TRAADLAPGDSEAWRRLALCYDEAGRAEESAATYQRAIQAQPDYYRHYLGFGTFYLNRGEFARAEEQYRRVAAIAPGLSSGHMNLGLALMQEGKFPEAEKELLEGLRLRESRSAFINVGALYYEEERFDEAARYFEKSLSFGAPGVVQYRDLGDAYRHLGKTRPANDAYGRALALAEDDIKRNPRKAGSHAALGLLAAFLHDRRRAEFEFSQALALEPENRVVIRDAAIGYEFLGDRDDALTALRKAPAHLLEELNRQPDVKELQNDPRFRSMLDKTPAQ
ncbi:MAG TPA: tetratricopeptide repeat protein, partial [Bryobacteraceae bacterium]